MVEIGSEVVAAADLVRCWRQILELDDSHSHRVRAFGVATVA